MVEGFRHDPLDTLPGSVHALFGNLGTEVREPLGHEVEVVREQREGNGPVSVRGEPTRCAAAEYGGVHLTLLRYGSLHCSGKRSGGDRCAVEKASEVPPVEPHRAAKHCHQEQWPPRQGAQAEVDAEHRAAGAVKRLADAAVDPAELAPFDEQDPRRRISAG